MEGYEATSPYDNSELKSGIMPTGYLPTTAGSLCNVITICYTVEQTALWWPAHIVTSR